MYSANKVGKLQRDKIKMLSLLDTQLILNLGAYI